MAPGSYDRRVPALVEAEARRRLAAARHATLATAGADATPHAVPVTFAVADGTLYSAVDDKPKRSARLRRLDNLAVNPAASVLVEEWHEDWTRLWWVRADGTARVLHEGPEHAAAVAALRVKYAQYADHALTGAVVAVALVRVTGWTASA